MHPKLEFLGKNCDYSKCTIGLQKYCIKMKLWIHICIELNNFGLLMSVGHVNVSSECIKSHFEQIQAIQSL